jgi:hypothetical protein
MASLPEILTPGFPPALAPVVQAAFGRGSWPFVTGSPVSTSAVFVAEVTVPYRVYLEDRQISGSDDEALVQHAVLSRHHDGHARERHLTALMVAPRPWLAPYVVALMGDYVLEILMAIETAMPPAMLTEVGAFVRANPLAWRTTQSRIASYWDAYHASTYPRRAPRFPGHRLQKDYPGFRLERLVSDGVRHVSGSG